MSQSKIEALKNSYRKAAVKQEILPHIEPLVKPTRDITIENRTVSLNLKQPIAIDTFAHQRKIQQLQRELEDLQFEHQANVVYNKQFKILGRLFGNESLEFQEIKQRIENTILNANCGIGIQSQHPTAASNLQKPGSSFENDPFSMEILAYSKEELRDKLVQANRSEFLSILQLGSAIVLENEPIQQRKRKSVREMFYEIWRDLLNSHQEVNLKLSRVQQVQQQSQLNTRREERENSYEARILQKNRNIADLADELEKINDQLIQKQKKVRMYKQNYETLEREYESANSQNKDHIQQIQALKKVTMNLQDKLRDYEDRQYSQQQKTKENKNEVELLRLQLKQAKEREQKKCNEMIVTIDQLMANVNKYDNTISELESEKNQNLRQIWIQKAKSQQLGDKLKDLEVQFAREKERYERLEKEFRESHDKVREFEGENEKRMHELNQQILSIREENDHKVKDYQSQIETITRAKQKVEEELEDLYRECEMLRDRGNVDSEPHTAVFGGTKLSEQMQLRTSIIDDRLVELQEALKTTQESSQKEIARLGSELSATKNGHEEKSKRLKEIENYLENLKNTNVSQEITIAQLREESKGFIKQINSLEQQVEAYKQRIKELEGHLEHEYINLNKEKDQYGDELIKMKQEYEKVVAQSSKDKLTLSQASKAQSQVQRKEEQIKKVSAKLEEQLTINKGIQEKVMSYQSLINDLELKFNQYSQQENQYKLNIENLEKELGQAKKEVQLLTQAKSAIEEEKTKLDKMMASLQEDHADKYKKMNNFIAERNGLISQLQQQVVALETELEQCRKEELKIISSKSLQVAANAPALLNQSLQTSPVKQAKEDFKEKYLQMANTLKTWQDSHSQLENENKQLADQLKKYQTQVSNLEQSLAHAQQYIKQLQALVEQKQQTIFQFQKQVSQKQYSSKSIQEDQQSLLQQLKMKCLQLQQQVAGNLQSIRAQDIYISDIKLALAKKVDELARLNMQFAEMENVSTSKYQDNASLKAETAKLGQQLRGMDQQIRILETENQGLKEMAESVKQLNQTLRSQNNSLKVANERLKSDISVLNSNNHILEEQKSQLLQQVKDLHERLRLSSEKLQISSVNQVDSSKRIMHKYASSNGNQVRSELQTIKEIMNSQNQLEDEANDHRNILQDPAIHVEDRKQPYSERNVRDNREALEASKRQSVQVNPVAVQPDLRQNQAYKSKEQVEAEKQAELYASASKIQNESGGSQYEYRYRPSIQKNSTKYEALLKQSEQLGRIQGEGSQINSLKLTPEEPDNREEGSPESRKTLIWSINRIGTENQVEGSNRQIASNSNSIKQIEGPHNSELNQEDLEEERDVVHEVIPSIKSIQQQYQQQQSSIRESSSAKNSSQSQQSQQSQQNQQFQNLNKGYSFVTEKYKNMNPYYSQQVIQQNQSQASNSVSSNNSISQSSVNRTQQQRQPSQQSMQQSMQQSVASSGSVADSASVVRGELNKLEMNIIDNNTSSLPNSSVSHPSQNSISNNNGGDLNTSQRYRSEQVVNCPSATHNQPISQHSIQPQQQPQHQSSQQPLNNQPQLNQQAYYSRQSSSLNSDVSSQPIKYVANQYVARTEQYVQDHYSSSRIYTQGDINNTVNSNTQGRVTYVSSGGNSSLPAGTSILQTRTETRIDRQPRVVRASGTSANTLQISSSSTLQQDNQASQFSQPSQSASSASISQQQPQTAPQQSAQTIAASPPATNQSHKQQISAQSISNQSPLVPIQEVAVNGVSRSGEGMSMMSKIIMESGTQNNIKHSIQSINSNNSITEQSRNNQSQSSNKQPSHPSQPDIHPPQIQPQQPQTQTPPQTSPQTEPSIPSYSQPQPQTPPQQQPLQPKPQPHIQPVQQLHTQPVQQQQPTQQPQTQSKQVINSQGLEGSSKSVVSQQELRQQKETIESPKPLPLPISIQESPATITEINSNLPSRNNIQPISPAQVVRPPPNFGPNVISADSETTFRQISQRGPQSNATISKEVSLKLEDQGSLSGQSASLRSMQNTAIRPAPPAPNVPIAKTDQIIPPSRSGPIQMPLSSPRIMPNGPPFLGPMQVIENRYPSPSKVVIVEKIDKNGGMQSEIRPIPGQFSMNVIQPKPNIERSRLSQVEQPRQPSIFGMESQHTTSRVVESGQRTHQNLYPSAKILSMNSQPVINQGRSPSPVQHYVINTVHQIPGGQPTRLVPLNPFEAMNSSSSRISLSPPAERLEGSRVDKRMFQTFNPHSSKRVSIYTNKPQQPRAQSPSERSQSPPSIATPINTITVTPPRSSNQIVMNPSQRSQNGRREPAPEVKQSQISNISEAEMQNNTSNNLSVYKSAIMMLDTRSHKRTSSLEAQVPDRNPSRFKTEANNVYLANEYQSTPTSVKVFETLQRPVSNLASVQNAVPLAVTKPSSPPMMSPSSVYGMDNTKTIKFRPVTPTFKQFPSEPSQSKYSTRPITHESRSASLVQPLKSTEYFPSKQAQQQQVFSSKHRIVDVEDSNSSGIEVQQRDSTGQCCPKC